MRIVLDGVEYKEGDYIRVMLKTFRGSMTLCEGELEYKTGDVASYGNGWGIRGRSGEFSFLSNIAKGTTWVESESRGKD